LQDQSDLKKSVGDTLLYREERTDDRKRDCIATTVAPRLSSENLSAVHATLLPDLPISESGSTRSMRR
jgi:hypothetical protein